MNFTNKKIWNLAIKEIRTRWNKVTNSKHRMTEERDSTDYYVSGIVTGNELDKMKEKPERKRERKIK